MGRHSERAYCSLVALAQTGIRCRYVDISRPSSTRRALRAPDCKNQVTIFFWRFPGSLVQQFPGRRVIWWFFESDRLPQKWLEQVRVFDQIWAPSAWARDILLRHGIASSCIRIVESGVNTQVFSPGRKPHGGFVYLSIGKYENRKSIDEVIAAFVAEFPAAQYPQVQLWLKADYPLFPQRVRDLARRLAGDARIRVISADLSDQQLADLYRSVDAFVFPSKAEGFGLPCIEAIACGVPVIATQVTAHTAFLDRIPGLFAPVDFKLAPIVDADYRHFYGADYGDEALGCWAIPSIDSLRAAMRDVFVNQQTWRDRALQAAPVIHREFSWESIARKAMLELTSMFGSR